MRAVPASARIGVSMMGATSYRGTADLASEAGCSQKTAFITVVTLRDRGYVDTRTEKPKRLLARLTPEGEQWAGRWLSVMTRWEREDAMRAEADRLRAEAHRLSTRACGVVGYPKEYRDRLLATARDLRARADALDG